MDSSSAINSPPGPKSIGCYITNAHKLSDWCEHGAASCDISKQWVDNVSCSKNGNYSFHLFPPTCPCERSCPPGTMSDIISIKVMCSLHPHHWHRDKKKIKNPAEVSSDSKSSKFSDSNEMLTQTVSATSKDPSQLKFLTTFPAH